MNVSVQQYNRLKRTFTHACLLFMVVLLLFPVYWMLNGSLKGGNLYVDPYSVFPNEINVDPYEFWLTDPDSGFWEAFRNSAVAVFVTLVIGLPVGAAAGYAMSRWRTRWIDFLFVSLFFLRMMPVFITAGPQFRLMIQLDLVGNVWGLYAIYIAISLPLIILVTRNFIMGLPGEIEEAALIDGASRFTVFWRIIFPLIKPALVTSAIWIFITLWLEYILAQQLMRGTYPNLAILLVRYSQQSGFSGNYRPDLVFGLGMIIMAPIMLVFPIVQRYIVSGLAAGALKG